LWAAVFFFSFFGMGVLVAVEQCMQIQQRPNQIRGEIHDRDLKLSYALIFNIFSINKFKCC